MSSLEREVSIEGLPLLGARVLAAEDPIFATLDTPDEYRTFASQLRGQFCVMVRVGERSMSITDPMCTYPIYFLHDAQARMFRVSTRMRDIASYAPKKISDEALFTYVHVGGTGFQTMYEGVRILPPATIARFEGDSMQSDLYWDWRPHLSEQDMSLEVASERLLEIASGYLRPILTSLKSDGICLLSGGTDSALVAAIAKKVLDLPVTAVTMDYDYRRYSEVAAAAQNAERIGVPLRRAVVSGRAFRRAFNELNVKMQDRPIGTAQALVFHSFAQTLPRSRLTPVLTGDHADSLFLGFDRFFRGLPSPTGEYLEAVRRMTHPDVARMILPSHRVSIFEEELLAALGLSSGRYREWLAERGEADKKALDRFVDVAPLPTLQQLWATRMAGIPWQHLFLPVERSTECVRFVSPFNDIEMIKFALALPAELKYRDGVMKALLRHTIKRWIDVDLPKIASPMPIRWWVLYPGLGNVDGPLRRLYTRLRVRNVRKGGRLYNEVLKVAALGRWLWDSELLR